jgi:hypothetical protein
VSQEKSSSLFDLHLTTSIQHQFLHFAGDERKSRKLSFLADQLPAFAARYARLPSRQVRRRLQRKLKRSVAAATLSLGMMPAHAATIKVDGSCKLYLAIHAANLDQSLGACARGKGADTIILLSSSVHQPSGIHNPTYGSTGLPVITSAIIIHSNGSTIPRVPTAPKFRILAVGGGGYLKLQSTTISGGVESRYGGDGIYVGTNEATGAKLTLVSTREIGITSVGIKISGFWCERGRGKLRRSRQSRVLYLCGDPE